MRATYAEINLSAIRQNFSEIQKHWGSDHFLCPMIKSNAYGHGDIEVAEVLSDHGARHLGVALVEEALKVADRLSPKTKILVFGCFGKESLDVCEEKGFVPIINRLQDLEILAQYNKNINFHIKFNTGMNRLGMDFSELKRVKELLNQKVGLGIQGICTHLSSADDLESDNSNSKKQLAQLLEIKEELSRWQPRYVHGLNSLAIEYAVKNSCSETLKIGARPGIMIYGGMKSSKFKLKPAMKLISKMVQIHHLNRGEAVSYSRTWVAQKPTRIGVIPIGYADGYPRALSNQALVWCEGFVIPVVGNICMDYTMLDLTHISMDDSSLLNKEVVLWGGPYEENHVEDISKKMGSISYELLSRVGIRVPRVFYK